MSDDDILIRAFGYPYDICTSSFGLDSQGNEISFDGSLITEEHVCVVGYGSNQSRQQLRRKFCERSEVGDSTLFPILVQRAELHDFQVVFAAYITKYGSIPANIVYCPGNVVSVSVTWLHPVQLAIMHSTESSYFFGTLRRPNILSFANGTSRFSRDECYIYVCKFANLLNSHSAVIPLSVMMSSTSDSTNSYDEKQALKYVFDMLKANEICSHIVEGMNLDDFVVALVKQGIDRFLCCQLIVDHLGLQSPNNVPGFCEIDC